MAHYLSPLAFAHDALEPHLGRLTLRLHHGHHHAGHVVGLNRAEARMQAALSKGDYGDIRAVQRAIAFHAGGMVLHDLYWEGMAPGGRKKPGLALARQIRADFGDLKNLQAVFSASAGQVEGSGWAVLAWDAELRRLLVLQCRNNQYNLVWSAVPLLVCDVWEHAYYLDYQNRRSEYVAAWWRLVNWDSADHRFSSASGELEQTQGQTEE